MQLPPRPNLRHLGNQAKALHKAHRDGDETAVLCLQANLPRFAGISIEEILKAELSLQEAQHVLAKEYGFAHWKDLSQFVRAREIPEDSIFAKDPDGWLEEAQDEEFSAVIEEHKTNKGIIRKKFNRSVHHDTYQVQYKEIISVPVWDTPEERETSNSYNVTHKISARSRDIEPQESTPTPQNIYNAAKDRVLGEVHENFCGRIATTLSRLASIETSAELFEISTTKYVDVASSIRNHDVLVYHFMLEPGGVALMLIAASSMCSFIGKRYPGKGKDTGLTSEEQGRALDVVHALLDELEYSWATQRRVKCSGAVLRQNDYRALDIDYEAFLKSVSIVIQSLHASQEFDLYYLDSTLQNILPPPEHEKLA